MKTRRSRPTPSRIAPYGRPKVIPPEFLERRPSPEIEFAPAYPAPPVLDRRDVEEMAELLMGAMFVEHSDTTHNANDWSTSGSFPPFVSGAQDV
jgi:hypothetical protein